MEDTVEITIRKAVLHDMPHIIRLAANAIVYSMSPYRNVSVEKAMEYRANDLKDLAKWLEPDIPAYIFVAETENGEICGHVIFALGTFGVISDQIAWILDITVSPDYMGTGLSKQLHQIVETILPDKNIGGICLSVTSSNKRAVRFYSNLGYEVEHLCLVKVIS